MQKRIIDDVGLCALFQYLNLIIKIKMLIAVDSDLQSVILTIS